MASASHRRSLRKRRVLVVPAAVVAAGVGAGALVLSANATSGVDLYHQTLAAKDGWASSGSGTTGGAKADAAHTFKVPANTTIVGVPGSKAGITGGMLQIQKVGNVIVRDLTFADTEDCFPQWDPTDGDDGNWNSEYDSVTLRGATHVWADHNTFTDAGHFDSANPKYYGREYRSTTANSTSPRARTW